MVRLEEMLCPIEEQLRQSEAAVGDISIFYPQHEDNWVYLDDITTSMRASESSPVDALSAKTANPKFGTNQSTESVRTWEALPGKNVECKLAEPYFGLKDQGWFGLMEHICEGYSTLESLTAAYNETETEEASANPQRRPNRCTNKSQIQLKSFVVPETPRGTPLILSALSQHPDRYCATVLGAGQAYDFKTACNSSSGSGYSNSSSSNSSSSNRGGKSSIKSRPQNSQEFKASAMTLPTDLIQSENEFIEKCTLRSAIAAAQNKKRRLVNANAEWTKMVTLGENSLQRNRAIRKSTEHNLMCEQRTHH